jgi:hypothetical protein
MTKEQLSTLQILLSKQEPENITRLMYMTAMQPRDDIVVHLKTNTAQFKIKPDGTATVRQELEVEL